MPTPHTAAAIVSMGDELLLGQSLDTNSKWIADRLTSRGVVPIEHVTVGDDLCAAVEVFRRLAARADLIVSTGGLGPTADDLTRQALAEAMGEPLVEDAEALGWIEGWFAGRGSEMPPLNRTQALRPRSARLIANEHGTAPGIVAAIAREGGGAAEVYCLPGPPSEMIPMWERDVEPALRPPAGRTIRTRVLHTFGIGESDLAGRLGDLMARTRNPLVGTTASKGVVSVRLRYEGPLPPEDAVAALDGTELLVRAAASPYLFGADPETLASTVLGLLRARGERLAVAESCTGGMLGEMLTETPGASDVFLGGWITYSNEMKTRELGVAGGLLGPGGPGAVSREVAEAMAAGALERSGADHALAITGIAGPGGGSEEKPVGTVWIARAARGGGSEARRFRFKGSRDVVRHRAAMCALGMLRFALADAAGTRMLWQVE